MTDPKDGRFELLSDRNCVLALVDYQAAMFKGVASGDKTIIKGAAVGAAKAASILGIPVVLSSINPEHNGEFIPEIAGLFPSQEVFARKIPGSTLSRTRGPGRPSSPLREKSWSYPDCGPACASPIPLFMP